MDVEQLPLPKTPGTYLIRNWRNGKVYVGSAAESVFNRCGQHQRSLMAGRHVNRYLQASWNRHGPDSFEFIAIESCDPHECLKIEQFWIDFLESFKSENGYNICPTAGSQLGTKRSLEFCKKNGDRDRGKKRSAEARKRIAEGQTGLKRSKAARERMKAAQNRPEVRAKITAAMASSAVKRKMRLVQLGKRHTTESKAKMSASRRGVSKSPEHRAAISAARMGHEVSSETRAKISRTLRNRRLDNA